MSISLQTNVGSFSAQNSLTQNFSRLNISVDRLSSGSKINRAADGASGLVLSEIHRAQLRGLEQGVANLDRAVSLVKTAETGLGEINDTLLRLRSIAVESSSTGSLDANAAAANQAEVDNLLGSIDRIANTTRFGNVKLLNGDSGMSATTNNSNVTALKATGSVVAGSYSVAVTTAATKAYAVASVTQGENQASGTFELSGAAATIRVTALNFVVGGNQGSAQDSSGNGVSVTLASGASDGATYNAGSKTITVTLQNLTTRTAADVRDVINADLGDSSGTGSGDFVAAVVSGGDNTLTAADATTYSNVTSGGQDIGSTLAQSETLTINGVGIELTAGMSQDNVISRINEFSLLTGVTAMTDTTVGNTGRTMLVANEFGSDGNFTVHSSVANSDEGSGGSGFGATAISATGVDVQGTINGVAAAGRANTLSLSGLTVEVGADENSQVDSYSGAAAATTVTVTDNSRRFQIGAYAGLSTKLSITAVKTTALGMNAEETSMTSLSQIGVGNFRKAQNSIRVIDQAISDVAMMRGTLGTFQKATLQTTQTSLQSQFQDIQKAESSVRGADYAAEISRYTDGMIRNQAVSSVLGLASRAGQSVLSLLTIATR